jgi:hypothetical protein
MCRQPKFVSFLMLASQRSCCGMTEQILLAELWERKVGNREFVKPKQSVTLLTLRSRYFEIYYYKYNKFIFNASGFDKDAALHHYYSLLNMFLKCYLNHNHHHKYHHLLQSRLLTVSLFGFILSHLRSVGVYPFDVDYVFVIILDGSFMRENLA